MRRTALALLAVCLPLAAAALVTPSVALAKEPPSARVLSAHHTPTRAARIPRIRRAPRTSKKVGVAVSARPRRRWVELTASTLRRCGEVVALHSSSPGEREGLLEALEIEGVAADLVLADERRRANRLAFVPLVTIEELVYPTELQGPPADPVLAPTFAAELRLERLAHLVLGRAEDAAPSLRA